VFGLDKSKPTPFNAANIPEAVNVKTKLTRNWIKILFCFPNIRFEIIEAKTNIQANAQTKIPTVMLEFNNEAKDGTDPIEDTIVVRAVLVKIW
jgi:hypothetical protein